MNILKKSFPAFLALFTFYNGISFAQHFSSDQQQLRLHVKKNGKIQFVDFALTKTYFAKATALTDELSGQESSQFTEKGSDPDSYTNYAYFLSKNGTIVAHSEDGDFYGSKSGFYSLSAYSFPSGISAEAFLGQSVETIENHPLFQKDREVYRLTVTLIVPKKEEPIALEASQSEDDLIHTDEITASQPQGN